MQAIMTKYFGPTNTKGSRIKAISEGGESITVPYDYALDAKGNHKEAARALLNRLGWHNEMTGGAIAGGYAFVIKNRSLIIKGEV